MGFDITALSLEEYNDDWGKKDEVAYHRAYMGGFRMMREQGYDWFDLINAYECYGGVSGTGEAKMINLSDLRNALKVLLKHKPTNLANNSFDNEKPEYRDEFNDRKPRLKDFMEKCIKWCEENNKEEILIYFG